MTLEGTNTYLYGSDPCTVIDPGPDIETTWAQFAPRPRSGRDRLGAAHPRPR